MQNKTLDKWEEKTIKDVAQINLGLTHTPKYVANGIPFLSVKDISSGKIDFSNTKYITKEEFESLPNGAKPQKGDVLFARVGTLGCPSIVNSEQKFGTFVSLGYLRVNKSLVLNTYIRYWMLSPLFWSQVNLSVQGSTLKNLNTGWLKDFKIRIPSLNEQQRIVETLDEAFENINNAKKDAEQNLNNAKELFESVLNDNFKNLENTSEFKQLSTITEVKDGTHDSPKYIKEGIPFITQKNIKDNGFEFITGDTKFISIDDHNKFYQRSNVYKNDILISMIGANRGMACIVDVEKTFSIKNVGLIKDNTNINRNYLLYYLKSNYAKQYIREKSNGGAQEFIGLTALRAFPILYADLEEQQKIVAQLDELQKQTKKLEQIYSQKIKDLEELKQSILQKAFNGEL